MDATFHVNDLIFIFAISSTFSSESEGDTLTAKRKFNEINIKK
jgi:signal peptidase I